MAFEWPSGVQNKTKRLVSQILWTLWLDFDGKIEDSHDAVKELKTALEAHGVVLKSDMQFRMMLPFMDRGKYGDLIRRDTSGRRTKSITLLDIELPEESHLPDGAGGYDTDERIDLQLFGAAAIPARGHRDDPTTGTELVREDPRDSSDRAELARETTRDPREPLAREDTRDKATELARGTSRDDGERRTETAELARETPRDDAKNCTETIELARELPRDMGVLAPGAPPYAVELLDDIDVEVSSLDRALDELLAPIPIDTGELRPQDLLHSIGVLMAGLEQLASESSGEPAGGFTEEERAQLLEEKSNLLAQASRAVRQKREAEERLIARNRELEGAQLQITALSAKYDQLERNMETILKGERATGTHLPQVQRFISERPHERQDRRTRRTTGSESESVYSVG